MKTNAASFNWRLAQRGVMLCSAALLLACGGGSPTTENLNPNTKTSLSGKVIDGYIEGATVCLDLNLNQACDSNEPSVITAAGGAYSLDVTGLTSAQVNAAHLFVNVPSTAKDADDAGKTLAQAGKPSFNLMAPAVAFVGSAGGNTTGAIISPITTMVSHQMIVGNGRSLEASKTAVANTLGLPASTDLMQDFVATPNASLHQQAQTIALAIGTVKATVLADSSAPKDQVALLAALDYLQAQIKTLLASISAGGSGAAPTPAQVATAITNNTTANSSSNPTNFIAGAQQTANSSVATSFASLMQAGFYWGECILDSQCGDVTYHKVKATSAGAFSFDEYFRNAAGAWVSDTSNSNSNNQFILTTQGWTQEANGCQDGTYTAESSGAALASCYGEAPVRISARSIDASGKKPADLGLTVPSAHANLVFPSSSTLYISTFERLRDEYFLFTGGSSVNYWAAGTSGVAGQMVDITTLADLMTIYSTANATASNRYLMWDGLTFTFNAGGTSTDGTVTLWGNMPSTCTVNPCRSNVGTAQYELRTVHGVQMLIVKKLHAYGDGDNMPLFSVKNGKVYGGDFQGLGGAYSNEKDYWFNKTMMNALLSAGNKPSVVN